MTGGNQNKTVLLHAKGSFPAHFHPTFLYIYVLLFQLAEIWLWRSMSLMDSLIDQDLIMIGRFRGKGHQRAFLHQIDGATGYLFQLLLDTYDGEQAHT